MSEHVEDASQDLARWLSDSGRRTWRPTSVVDAGSGVGAKESSAELFRYLEELAGKELRSREDIRRYVSELSAANSPIERTDRRQRLVKDTVLLLCLLTAYIQYNFLDVNLQIARLPSIVIFVPMDAVTRPLRTSTDARPDKTDPSKATAAAFDQWRAEIAPRRA